MQYEHWPPYCGVSNPSAANSAIKWPRGDDGEPLRMRCVRTPRRILFQARSVIFHEASLTKVFIAAWENYPRRLFATLAMRYSDFSERLSAPAAASSRNNVFAVHRKGLLMFVMFVMDSNTCEGVFGIKTNTSRFIWTTWQCYTVINDTLKNGSPKVYQNLWRTL